MFRLPLPTPFASISSRNLTQILSQLYVLCLQQSPLLTAIICVCLGVAIEERIASRGCILEKTEFSSPFLEVILPRAPQLRVRIHDHLCLPC